MATIKAKEEKHINKYFWDIFDQTTERDVTTLALRYIDIWGEYRKIRHTLEEIKAIGEYQKKLYIDRYGN